MIKEEDIEFNPTNLLTNHQQNALNHLAAWRKLNQIFNEIQNETSKIYHQIIVELSDEIVKKGCSSYEDDIENLRNNILDDKQFLAKLSNKFSSAIQQSKMVPWLSQFQMAELVQSLVSAFDKFINDANDDRDLEDVVQAACSDFFSVHIVLDSRRNIRKLIRELQSCEGLPDDEKAVINKEREQSGTIESHGKKLLRHPLFTPKEFVYFKTLAELVGLTHDDNANIPINLTHGSLDASVIIKSGKFISTEQVLDDDPEKTIHTPNSFGLRKCIFFTLTGEQKIPRFLQGNSDVLALHLSVLKEPGLNKRRIWWATFHDWYYYRVETRFPPVYFGLSKKDYDDLALDESSYWDPFNPPHHLTTELKQKLQKIAQGAAIRTIIFQGAVKKADINKEPYTKTIFYNRGTGIILKRKVSFTDEVYYATDILWAALYNCILELRFIGGKYREHVLNSAHDKDVVLDSFNNLMSMEVKAIHRFDHKGYINKNRSKILTVEAKIVQQFRIHLLFYAIYINDLSSIKKLLNDIDINCQDALGVSPLICAILFKKAELARYFISIGANVNHFDLFFSTALIYAILLNHSECLTILLKLQLPDNILFANKADLDHKLRSNTNVIDKLEQYKVFYQALHKNGSDIFDRELKRFGWEYDDIIHYQEHYLKTLAQFEKIFSYKYNSMRVAIVNGNVNILRLLCQHYSTLKNSMIELAITEGKNDIIQILIHRYSDSVFHFIYIAFQLEQYELFIRLLREHHGNLTDNNRVEIVEAVLAKYVTQKRFHYTESKQQNEFENVIESVLIVINELFGKLSVGHLSQHFNSYLKQFNLIAIRCLAQLDLLNENHFNELFRFAVLEGDLNRINELKSKISQKGLCRAVAARLARYVQLDERPLKDDFELQFFQSIIEEIKPDMINELYSWFDEYHKQNYPFTLFMGFVAYGSIDFCLKLIAKGADITIAGKETALMIACRTLQPNMLLFLLQQGLSLQTPIKIWNDTLKIMDENNVYSESCNNVISGYSDYKQFLSRANNKVNNNTFFAASTPEVSDDESEMSGDKIKMIESAKSGKQGDIISTEQLTPISMHHTFSSENVGNKSITASIHQKLQFMPYWKEAIKMLIDISVQMDNYVELSAVLKNENKNIMFGNGESIWHYAILLKNKKLIRLLSYNQFNINVFNQEGKTPLQLAVEQRCDIDIIKQMLKCNAYVSLCLTKSLIDLAHTSDIKTILYDAIMLEDKEAVKEVLSQLLISVLPHSYYSYSVKNKDELRYKIFNALDNPLVKETIRYNLGNIVPVATKEELKIICEKIDLFENDNDLSLLKLVIQSIRYSHDNTQLEDLLSKLVDAIIKKGLYGALALFIDNGVDINKCYSGNKSLLRLILENIIYLCKQGDMTQNQSQFNKYLSMFSYLIRADAFVNYPNSDDNLTCLEFFDRHMPNGHDQIKNDITTLIAHAQISQKTAYIDWINSNVIIPLIRQACELMLRCFIYEDFVKSKDNRIIFKLNRCNQSLNLPVFFYLMGYEKLTGRCIRDISISDGKYEILCNNKPRKISESVSPIYLRGRNRHPLVKEDDLLHGPVNSINEILSRLLSYEFESFFASCFNLRFYLKNRCLYPKASQYYHSSNEGHFLGLGAGNAHNMLVPDRWADGKVIATINGRFQITVTLQLKVTSDYSIQKAKNDLIKYLDIDANIIDIKNNTELVIKMRVNEFLSHLMSKTCENIGIVHLNDKGEIAMAERISNGYSLGKCTPGGFCAEKYLPMLGACIESINEANLTIINPHDMVLLKDDGTKTYLVRHNQYDGKLKCNQEYIPGSDSFISFKQIRQQRFLLRLIATSLFDYLNFEQSQLTNELAVIIPEFAKKVTINTHCDEISTKNCNYLKPSSLFGIITISLSNPQHSISLFANKFKTIFPDIQFTVENRSIIIADINPAELLMALQAYKSKIEIIKTADEFSSKLTLGL